MNEWWHFTFSFDDNEENAQREKKIQIHVHIYKNHSLSISISVETWKYLHNIHTTHAEEWTHHEWEQNSSETVAFAIYLTSAFCCCSGVRKFTCFVILIAVRIRSTNERLFHLYIYIHCTRCEIILSAKLSPKHDKHRTDWLMSTHRIFYHVENVLCWLVQRMYLLCVCVIRIILLTFCCRAPNWKSNTRRTRVRVMCAKPRQMNMNMGVEHWAWENQQMSSNDELKRTH